MHHNLAPFRVFNFDFEDGGATIKLFERGCVVRNARFSPKPQSRRLQCRGYRNLPRARATLTSYLRVTNGNGGTTDDEYTNEEK